MLKSKEMTLLPPNSFHEQYPAAPTTTVAAKTAKNFSHGDISVEKNKFKFVIR